MSYVILCRHAAAAKGEGRSSEVGLSDAGRAEATVVAGRLAETLATQPGPQAQRRAPIELAEAWHGSHRVVRETAGVLAHALATEGVEPAPAPERWTHRGQLDPEEFWRAGDADEVAEELRDELQILGERPGSGNAILVVGHEPQIGWLAAALLRERGRRRQTVAIARAEAVCIALTDPMADRRRLPALRRRSWPLWAIAPRDLEVVQQLRDKVRSKMDVAKVLGAVVTVLLGVLADPAKLARLGEAPGSPALGATGAVSAGAPAAPWQVVAASLLLLLALGLFLATLYAYDRLLMPSRFWAAGTARRPRRHERRWLAERPPSPDARVLHQNMVRTWRWLFTPATYALGAALLLFAEAAVDPEPWPWYPVAGALAVALVLHCRAFRPVLGTED